MTRGLRLTGAAVIVEKLDKNNFGVYVGNGEAVFCEQGKQAAVNAEIGKLFCRESIVCLDGRENIADSYSFFLPCICGHATCTGTRERQGRQSDSSWLILSFFGNVKYGLVRRAGSLVEQFVNGDLFFHAQLARPGAMSATGPAACFRAELAE